MKSDIKLFMEIIKELSYVEGLLASLPMTSEIEHGGVIVTDQIDKLVIYINNLIDGIPDV
jgi:hypothetical protein